jgi:hypothetical protein
MIQAQARGLIDYRELDPRDPNWFLRHKWLLNELYRQQLREVHLAELHYWLHTDATSQQGSNEFRKGVLETIDSLRTSLQHACLPWIEEKETARKQELKQLSDEWIEYYGDPRDPKTAAKLQELLDYFTRNQAQAKQGR